MLARLSLALLAALPPLLTAPAPAQPRAVSNWAADPSFRLLNRGAAPVQAIQVTASGRRDPGANRLGPEALEPGRQARVALPAGQCLNDIRVTFANGRALERRRVDTCAAPQLAFP